MLSTIKTLKTSNLVLERNRKTKIQNCFLAKTENKNRKLKVELRFPRKSERRCSELVMRNIHRTSQRYVLAATAQYSLFPVACFAGYRFPGYQMAIVFSVGHRKEKKRKEKRSRKTSVTQGFFVMIRAALFFLISQLISISYS